MVVKCLAFTDLIVDVDKDMREKSPRAAALVTTSEPTWPIPMTTRCGAIDIDILPLVFIVSLSASVVFDSEIVRLLYSYLARTATN